MSKYSKVRSELIESICVLAKACYINLILTENTDNILLVNNHCI